LPDFPLPYRWLIMLSYVATIVALSIAPGHAQPDDTIFSWLVVFTATPVQKALHFVIYAALVMLWMWTLEGIRSRSLRALLSVALAIGLGAVLECYQLSVPGRFGSFADVLLNSAGAIAGLLLAMILL
jgi:glycopeptide antibiotics resistance protein